MIIPSKVRKKNLVLSNLDMFVWTSGFHNPFDHTHFNMFVDEWMSSDESPELLYGMATVRHGREDRKTCNSIILGVHGMEW